jgi:phospholipid/cholesterol/gamma-HCH transport system substrate-binding protein
MERTAVSQARIANLGFKVGVLLTLIPAIVIGLLIYALHARGVFVSAQALTLVARDADGVSVGMPVVFSGIPVGQVTGMTLGEDGQVRVQIRVREKDAHWLRTTTVFSIDRPIFGNARIRAATANMNAPPLAAGAEALLQSTDSTQDLPQVIARANAILEQIEEITRPESGFNRAIANLEAVSVRMAGEHGILESLTGSPEQAQRVLQTMEDVNALVAALRQVTVRADGVLAKTDERMFGDAGVVDQAQASLAEVAAILSDARDSLRKADAILANAQSASEDVKGLTASMREAGTDLGALRTEVDQSIRNVNALLAEIGRKWPFARDTEIRLP